MKKTKNLLLERQYAELRKQTGNDIKLLQNDKIISQNKIKKLESKKLELIQITEMLLSQQGK